MQLIWLSGPTGKRVSLSITRRTVLLASAALAGLLVVIGIALHFVGLRIAVAYSPAVAQQIGGVTSVMEQERIEQAYRSELNQLRQSLGQLTHRVSELETSKIQLSELVGIRNVQPNKEKSSWFGRGGPLYPLNLPGTLLPGLSIKTPALATELALTSREWQQLDQSWSQLNEQWQAEGQRLIRLPVGLPLLGDFQVSSGFGVRIDPLRGLPSMHEGMDFIVPPGTPVLATAPGVVTRSEWAGDYGQMVEVAHGEHYKTRYAHLRLRQVGVGQTVARGQALGESGNTGRSTGPHLHYEVEHMGRNLDPTKALRPLAWR
jgi:murein DD-endopeptidase MepM/ murein hydrolase activator NlpD